MPYFNYYTRTNLLHGSLSEIMGTRLDFILIGLDKARAELCWEETSVRIQALHTKLNLFDEESEVAHLNRNAHRFPYCVSNELFKIIQLCKEYEAKTLGYFDISTGKMNEIELSEEDKTVYFSDENISIDLGGFAKGYALEQIKAILESYDAHHALINLGNSAILAIGSHPHGNNWPITIENPYITEQKLCTVELLDSSLSVSGNMPSHPKHIFNPKTGAFEVKRNIAMVHSSSPLEAEVLSTTLMIAEEEERETISNSFETIEQQLFSLENK